MISPHFGKLEAKYPNVKFVKVDVEEQPVSLKHMSHGVLERSTAIMVDVFQEIAQEQGIRAMPTFIAYKNGERVADVTGAVPAKLTVSDTSLAFVEWESDADRQALVEQIAATA